MATERLRITPDYIIAKNSAGVVTYSAGTVPETGTEFPSYLRSTASSDTVDVNSGYDIYYNQLAPIPYPVINNANIRTIQTIGGSIFSLNQVPVVTSDTAFNNTLTEPGTYVIVPSLWFTESGTPQNYKNKPNLGNPTENQVAYTVRFNGVSSTILVTRRVFSDGSIGWFGPTSEISVNPDTNYVSGGDLTTVPFNYGMTNPDSLSLSDPASYNTTYSTPVFSIIPSSAALAAAGVSASWTRGVIKVLYYSRGYLKLRYTK
jgi:hypothetical protein